MSVMQLELDFQGAISAALVDPVAAEPIELFDALLPLLDASDKRTYLSMAAQLYGDVAEVIYQRSELLIEEWQDKNNEEGPVIDFDELEGLVRQSMVFELDDLMAEPEPVTRRSFPKGEVESRVAIVEKEVLLQELESELQEPEDVLEVIEEESVSDWVDAIAKVLEAEGGVVSFSQLLENVGLSGGRVFLGLLLGRFWLRQQGRSFYGSELMVCGEGCDR